MPNILIRSVRPEVHAELTRRAADRGQSLQAYLMAELEHLVARPTVDEVLARIDRRPDASDLDVDEIVRTIREDRDTR